MVGMGNISRHMFCYLKENPWFHCVGIVNRSDDGLRVGRHLADVPESSLFKDLDAALLSLKPDAVLINTPSELHFTQAKQCLEAKCHTLVAKPVTNDFAQAFELVNLARSNEVTLSVGQQIRYNQHYTALAAYLKAGTLGTVEAAWFMNSKPRPKVANLARMLQPALFENTCHHFDNFLAVFEGHNPLWISCDGFNPSWSKYVGPCMVNALIRFSGNLHLTYHGGFSSQSPMYEFRIEGSAGAIRCHGVHMSNDKMDYQIAPVLGSFTKRQIDEQFERQDPWIPFLNAWYGYVRGGVEPPFSGRNNLKVFAMLSAAIDSVNTGRPVEIAGHKMYGKVFT